MDGVSLFWKMAITLSVGAGGLYLLLPRREDPIAPRLRQGGGIAAALALTGLAIVVGRAEVASEGSSAVDSASVAARLALAVAGVVCGTFTVFSERPLRSAFPFLLLHPCNAGLFALDHAWRGAAAILVVGSVAGCSALWQVRGRAITEMPRVQNRGQADEGSHADRQNQLGEPLLACVAAGLLTLAMAWAFANQLPLYSVALFGVIVFAIGGIGFVARTGLIAVAFSWGVMIQGGLMTLAGFLRVHNPRQGDAFALLAVVVAGIEGVAALALIRFFDHPNSSMPNEGNLAKTPGTSVEEWHG